MWAERYLPRIVLAILGVCFVFVWIEDLWRPAWDSAMYLKTAQSLAEGEGYQFAGRTFFLRPPGVAWVLSFFEDDGWDFRVLNRLMGAFAAATIAAIYLVVKQLHGKWMALGVALLSATSPLFLSYLNWVISEFPYLALFFATLYLLHRSMEPAPENGGSSSSMVPWWTLAAGLCFGCTLYVRTAGLLIVPAVVCFVFVRRRQVSLRGAIVPVLVAGALLIPWLRYSKAAEKVAERPVVQMNLFTYSTGMFHEDPGDPDSPRIGLGGFWERALHNDGIIITDVASTLPWMPEPLEPLLILALVLGCAWTAWKHHSLLEWTAAGYSATILFYFSTERRLALPLVPFVFLYLLAPLKGWCEHQAGRPGWHRIRGLPVVLFALLFVGNLIVMPHSLTPQVWPDDYPQATVNCADKIRDIVPEDKAFAAHAAPLLSVLTGREAYTYKGRDLKSLVGLDFDYVVIDHDASSALQKFVAKRAVQAWVFEADAYPLQAIYRLDRSGALGE